MKRLLAFSAIILLAACTKKDNKPSGSSGMSDAEMQALLVDKKWQIVDGSYRDTLGVMHTNVLANEPPESKDDYWVWYGDFTYAIFTNGTSKIGPVPDTAEKGTWLLNNATIHMVVNDPNAKAGPIHISQITGSSLNAWMLPVSPPSIIDTVFFKMTVIP